MKSPIRFLGAFRYERKYLVLLQRFPPKRSNFNDVVLRPVDRFLCGRVPVSAEGANRRSPEACDTKGVGGGGSGGMLRPCYIEKQTVKFKRENMNT